jgi:hypothetical protein
MVGQTTDELGLCLENTFLVAYIPATNKAFVWNVKARMNKGYEIINYGPLPLTSGSTLTSYDGGSITVPANGILPMRSFTPNGITFPLANAYDSTDMWFLKERDYSERVFHVIMDVSPSFIRIDVQAPIGTSLPRFQRDKITVGVDKSFGWRRGEFENIHMPGVHEGYRFGNDSNVAVYTNVRFIYGEYIIQTPRDPNLIFDILNSRIPAKWVTLPFTILDSSIQGKLVDNYGFDGFPVYALNQRATAVTEYTNILNKIIGGGFP